MTKQKPKSDRKPIAFRDHVLTVKEAKDLEKMMKERVAGIKKIVSQMKRYIRKKGKEKK
jgi:hypothetical protein